MVGVLPDWAIPRPVLPKWAILERVPQHWARSREPLQLWGYTPAMQDQARDASSQTGPYPGRFQQGGPGPRLVLPSRVIPSTVLPNRAIPRTVLPDWAIPCLCRTVLTLMISLGVFTTGSLCPPHHNESAAYRLNLLAVCSAAAPALPLGLQLQSSMLSPPDWALEHSNLEQTYGCMRLLDQSTPGMT